MIDVLENDKKDEKQCGWILHNRKLEELKWQWKCKVPVSSI